MLVQRFLNIALLTGCLSLAACGGGDRGSEMVAACADYIRNDRDFQEAVVIFAEDAASPAALARADESCACYAALIQRDQERDDVNNRDRRMFFQMMTDFYKGEFDRSRYRFTDVPPDQVIREGQVEYIMLEKLAEAHRATAVRDEDLPTCMASVSAFSFSDPENLRILNEAARR